MRRPRRTAGGQIGSASRRARTDPWERLPPRLRVALRELRMSLDPVLGGLVQPIENIDAAAGRFWRVPRLPRLLRRIRPAPVWPAPSGETPEGLRTTPGIWRDPQAEEDAFRAQPVHNYFRLHPDNLPRAARHSWHFVLPAAPVLERSMMRIARLRSSSGAPGPLVPAPDDDARAALTERIRAEAHRLGLNAVGFTAYDRRYTLAENQGTHDEGSVIVVLFEQDWAATQTAPSARAERAAFRAYAGLMERIVGLAEFVERQGHRAHPHSFLGETVAITYGVAAGLGQLGLNGQLLTPAAGSRARLSIITTNADLVHDEPRDFGIHTICDSCQACVRRCPVGAIPNRRQVHRGVTKVKIKTERCLPTVMGAEGCAVCMKVCPVQRYGLDAVHEHWVATGGTILGRDTDELEGYTWPSNGRRYGPGQKPDAELVRAVLNPPHWVALDPSRTVPQDTAPAQDLRHA